MDFTVTPGERETLRELARLQAEYANLPIMKERTERWYAHNALRGDRPMVIVELDSFRSDLVKLQCESPLAREIEETIKAETVRHELIDDDNVVPDCYYCPIDVKIDEYGIPMHKAHAVDSLGRSLGYRDEHPITCIADDFRKLKPPSFTFDREAAESHENAIREIIGDILPVVRDDTEHRWHNMLTPKIVQLMGMENWMMSMIDEPDEVHRLMRYLLDSCRQYLRWHEEMGLLTMNNGNHFAGAGSRGFTSELSLPADGRVTSRCLWGNTNSQESSSISPEMYGEFVYPYVEELAREYGLLYYGCCEPVDPVWDRWLKNLPNLRKVSISAWCNEEMMGEAPRGGKVIYSRKPFPNFLGVDRTFDEEGFTAHIAKTLRCASGCRCEIIFRDVYTLTGDNTRAGRAVKIVRRLIDEIWK
jgi:hypothetical protein